MDTPSIVDHNAEPITAENAPFLTELRYRADDYSSLRYKMLRHLEEIFPRWNGTLAENQGQQDMGVAMVELFAYLADILGFYQDRRANEGFLRTAVLRASLIDLCALVDYRMAPGSSASTLQAFLLKEGESGTVPARFQVKTEAADGLPALVFETLRDIKADALRNELRLDGHDRSTRRLNAPGLPVTPSELLDQGYAGLKAGAFVVFSAPGSPPLAVQLTAVSEEDEKRRISWAAPAVPAGADLPVAELVIHGKPTQSMFLQSRARADEITAGQNKTFITPPGILQQDDRVLFVSEGLMEPAKLVGPISPSGRILWNRPFAISLRRSETRIYRGITVGHTDNPIKRGATEIRRNLTVGATLVAGDQLLITDGAGVERVMVAGSAGSRVFLAEPVPRAFRPISQEFVPHNTVELHRVVLPGEGVGFFSEFVDIRPNRLDWTETVLELDDTYEGLEPQDLVVFSDGGTHRVHELAEVAVNAEERTVLTLANPVGLPFDEALLAIHGPFELAMRIDGYDRSEQSTLAGETRLTFAGPVSGLKPGDYLVVEGGGHAEGSRITALSNTGGLTVVDLETALLNAYPLAETVVYGNVAAVNHGETVVEEVLGSGDHSRANQSFTLHRDPTTFVHDAEGRRGVANTLEVFVEGERWREVESLAESAADALHYVTEIDDEQSMTFRFGDDRHGARLTTGRNNVRVRYRVGLGAEGNVPAAAIHKMPAALPIIDSTKNPLPTAGGQDRESLEDTRRLAPVTVRTLERAVSLADYADLTLAYAGIAKARADWAWEEGRRVIQLTVAAVDGQPLAPTFKDALRGYLDARRSPHHRLRIRDHWRLPVHLELQVQVLPQFLKMETKVRVEEALGPGLTEDGERGFFHFDGLALGEDLHLSEVYALVEGVRGVDYVVARAFHAEGPVPPGAVLRDRIIVAQGAVASGGDPADASLGVLKVQATGGIV